MTGDTNGEVWLGGYLRCQDSPVQKLHLEVLMPFASLYPEVWLLLLWISLSRATPGGVWLL